jgi:hypothetical protein
MLTMIKKCGSSGDGLNLSDATRRLRCGQEHCSVTSLTAAGTRALQPKSSHASMVAVRNTSCDVRRVGSRRRREAVRRVTSVSSATSCAARDL